MRLKLLAFAISTFGALGASGASADVTLTVALNSPEGAHTVVGPAEATGGAITAFTAVTDAGVVIDNIDVAF